MDYRAKHFWDYYLILESDFIETTRFVEVNEENFPTYSIKYVQLLLSIGSELDVIYKAYCELLEPNEKLKNAKDYKKIILNSSDSIQKKSVVSRQFSLKINPFENWKNIKQPSWWDAYNAVKHRRNEDYYQANLENVVYALAALFILNMHYRLKLKEIASPDYPIDMRHVLRDFSFGQDLFRLDDVFLYLEIDSRIG